MSKSAHYSAGLLSPMLTWCKQMIQIHNQKGAVWNDKLHEYILLDVGGSGTVICI